jgi:DNA-binding NarL/FixJ family response regulator
MELAAVRLLVEGMSNDEIAAHLLKSVNTVKGQIAQALDKAGVHSRVELALWAVAHGHAEIPERLR